jgi:hypothetical protein
VGLAWNWWVMMRVSCSSAAAAAKFRASVRFPKLPETLQMVITAAHLPAIVALLAGILILVMPRFLNFVVAIYLIFVGLHGLGVFKWLRL